MACGCVDNSCSCVVTGGPGVTVSGAGTIGNPYTISSANATLAALGNVSAQIYEYDFADLGGATGDIILTDPSNVAQQMPAGTMVVHSMFQLLDPLTSGGNPDIKIGWGGGSFDGAIVTTDMASLNTITSLQDLYTASPFRDIHAVAQDLVLNIGGPDLTGGRFQVMLILTKLA